MLHHHHFDNFLYVCVYIYIYIYSILTTHLYTIILPNCINFIEHMTGEKKEERLCAISQLGCWIDNDIASLDWFNHPNIFNMFKILCVYENVLIEKNKNTLQTCFLIAWGHSIKVLKWTPCGLNYQAQFILLNQIQVVLGNRVQVGLYLLVIADLWHIYIYIYILGFVI